MNPALELGLAGSLLGWAGGVTVVSAVAMARALSRPEPAPRSRASQLQLRSQRVVVVRPCAGLEPHLRRSLESTASLRYCGPLRVVFSTSTTDDEARPVLLEVASQLRARGMDVKVQVVEPRGPNRKASQLSGLLDSASDDVALVVDSDVELEGLDLEGLDLEPMVAALLDPVTRMAAVWYPPVEREPKSVGDRMSAALLGGSLHAFGLLGTLDPGGLVGKTFAVRLAAVQAVGGFEGLVQYLGEDMELARRLRSHGWGITMSPRTTSSLASRRSARQVLARYVRWLLIIRAQRPLLLWSYPLLLVATPGLLLCGSLGLLLQVPGAGLAMVLATLTRLSVALVASKLARRGHSLARMVVDTVLADLLLLIAFIRALGPTRVHWRDRSLRLGPRGLLESIPGPSRTSA